MKMDKIACECMGVTNGDIKAAVDNGTSSLEEVQEETGASTCCGACTDAVERLVDYFATERDE